MKNLYIYLLFFACIQGILGQQESEIRSDGIVFPVMSQYPTSPVQGQVIFYTGGVSGEYQYYDGSSWNALGSGNSGGALHYIEDFVDGDTKVITAENGINDYIDFHVEDFAGIQFTKALSDDVRIELTSTSSLRNTFIGKDAGADNTNAGTNNTFIGYTSGSNNIEGDNNTYLGVNAGNFNEMGSRNTNIGRATGYRNKKSDNTYLGYFAGTNSDDSERLIAIGSYSGYNTEGNDNVFIGYNSGRLNDGGGEENVGVGNNTLYNTGNNKAATNESRYNTAIGHNAGYTNDKGYNNAFVGKDAGHDNFEGYQNTFIGFQSGYKNKNGHHNTYLGDFSGLNNGAGTYNTMVGSSSGYNSTGNHNTFMGEDAGRNTDGDGNVFLGWEAGYSEDGNNKLIISNDRNKELVYGEFDNDLLRITGNLQLADPSSDDVEIRMQAEDNSFGRVFIRQDVTNDIYLGDIDDKDAKVFLRTAGGDRMSIDEIGNIKIHNFTGGGTMDVQVNNDGVLVQTASDLRLKKNVRSISGALDKILKIRGVEFEWKDTENPSKTYGVIAQEMLEVIPDIVTQNPHSPYYGVNYSEFPALLIEAIKEQQQIIDGLKNDLDNQNQLIKNMTAKIEQLETTQTN